MNREFKKLSPEDRVFYTNVRNEFWWQKNKDHLLQGALESGTVKDPDEAEYWFEAFYFGLLMKEKVK